MTVRFFKHLFLLMLLLSTIEAGAQTSVQIFITNCSYQVNANIAEPTCNGDGSGAVNLSFSGIPDQPEMEWIYPDGVVPANTDNTTAEQEFLFAGNYKVRLARAGCVDTIQFLMGEPEAISIDVAPKEETCFGDADGEAEVFAGGGVGQLRFSLNGNNFFELNHFQQLPPDEYLMYVKDANNCVRTKIFTVPAAPDHQVEVDKQHVTCPGGNDGFFIVVIDSGAFTDDFEFSLDGTDYIPEPTFENLGAGEYTIHARSPKGCIKTRNFIIQEPDETEVFIEKEDVSCPDGNDAVFIVVIDSGAFLTGGDHEYSLNGDDYQPDSVFTNLEAGDYTVYARNQFGCVATKPVTVSQPTAPNVQMELSEVLCYGDSTGSLTINMTGATPPYFFSLDSVNFQTENIFANLPEGIYTLYISDANGCSYNSNFQMTQPTPLLNDINFSNATCGTSNGWIAAAANGGTSPFTYLWDNGNTSSSLLWIDEGDFELTVTDANGCQRVDIVTIINEVAPLIGGKADSVTCFSQNNGAITTTIEGYAPYDFQWSNGATSADIENLGGGEYIITVTDKNNCITSKSFFVVEPDSLDIDPKIQNSGEVGNINLAVKGGTPPFTYFWNTGDETPTLRGLNYGTYEVTVFDANDCMATTEIELDLPNRKIELGEMVNIFPVPTFRDLNVSFDLPAASDIQINIYDELGRQIFNLFIPEIKRETILLDVEYLQSGMYFIKIESGLHSSVERFIKQTE